MMPFKDLSSMLPPVSTITQGRALMIPSRTAASATAAEPSILSPYDHHACAIARSIAASDTGHDVGHQLAQHRIVIESSSIAPLKPSASVGLSFTPS